MTIEDACERLAKRRLEFDCREIRFERRLKAPASFGGPGNIWRDETGSLGFKVHLDEPGFLIAKQAVLGTGLPPGELIPDDFLFEISAIAYDGTTWSGKCWPGGMTNILANTGVATGSVQELKSESFGTGREDVTEEQVIIYLPYVLDFPKVT